MILSKISYLFTINCESYYIGEKIRYVLNYLKSSKSKAKNIQYLRSQVRNFEVLYALYEIMEASTASRTAYVDIRKSTFLLSLWVRTNVPSYLWKYSCLKNEITIWSCLIRWLSMRQLNFEFPIYCDVIKNGDQAFWVSHRKNTFFFKSLEREELICLHIVYKSLEIPPLNIVQYDIINFRQLYSNSIF